MRRTLKLIILALIWVVTVTSCRAESSGFKNWRGSAEIRVEGTHLYKSVFLEPGVYRAARPDLADLRLTDERGEPVPFIIQSAIEKRQWRETTLDGRLVYRFKKKMSIFFDFQIQPSNTIMDTTGNRLQFDLPNEDFLKRIRVYGSYDGEIWGPLGEGTLYQVQGLVKDDFDLEGRLKYGFYRVELIDNAEGLNIEGIHLIDGQGSDKTLPFEKMARLCWSVREKNGWTVISLRNPDRLKIVRISLKAQGTFKRGIEVQDDEHRSLPIVDSWIYQFVFGNDRASQTQIELAQASTSSSRLDILINNRSDKPIKIEGIQVTYLRDRLIFEGQPGRVYCLRFGNPQADRPSYDMELLREPILKEAHDPLKIEGIILRELHEEKLPDRRLGMTVFNVIIGLTALIMIVILVKRIRWNA